MDHYAALQNAERTIRAWHKVARQMCDLAIGGDCKGIERVYFDAALSLPFYGVDPDSLPSERLLGAGQASLP